MPSLPGTDNKKRTMNHGRVCQRCLEWFMLLDATVLPGKYTLFTKTYLLYINDNILGSQRLRL